MEKELKPILKIEKVNIRYLGIEIILIEVSKESSDTKSTWYQNKMTCSLLKFISIDSSLFMKPFSCIIFPNVCFL